MTAAQKMTIDKDVIDKMIQAIQYMDATIRDSGSRSFLEQQGINMNYLDEAAMESWLTKLPGE